MQHDPATLLKLHNLHANKRLGQNFLTDPLALKKIVDSAMILPSDSVLEIGAGLGSLTSFLAKSAREVVAVEVDQKLALVLREVLESFQNVRLVFGDILTLLPTDLGLQADYIVASNIPYHITSAIIRHLLEARPKPRRIVLTIQEEVAIRICAAPPEMSVLALSVQVYGKPEIVTHVSAGAFYPVPGVDSAVVRMEIFETPAVPDSLLPVFFMLIKAGFGQKRKTLRNSLSSGLRIHPERAEKILLQAGVDPHRRAETLNLGEWKNLCDGWLVELKAGNLTNR